MIKALYFGRVPYLTGLQIQECLFDRVYRKRNSEHFLCLFEHPPVYTVGIREQLYSEQETQRLRSLGAEFHRIGRGGLITFHGPGQLVAYPVFDLHQLASQNGSGHLGVRKFVHSIEETILRLLRTEFALPHVDRTQNAGVWVDGTRKIAAIGIQVRHAVTSHGLALNCSTDLHWFEQIVPCGLQGKSATSISRELSRQVDIADVLVPFCAHFQSVFDVPVHLELEANAQEYCENEGKCEKRTEKNV